MMTDPLDPDSQPDDKQPLPPQETPPPYEAEATPAPSTGSSVSGLHFPAMGLGKLNQKDEKFWASLGHLLSLTGIVTGGIGYVVGPLVPYLLKKGESPFVDEHNRETLNFSIVTFLVIWISGLAGLAACVAWIPGAIMAVLNLIFCIQGAIAAKDGQAYRYPFNWRVIKN
ncbi:MAG: DUF4870 domain-containing protein [Verrucomicrobiales bacterium]|nr:DUF4870 domain-containing protein [Verrucomicrobiales bacterium]